MEFNNKLSILARLVSLGGSYQGGQLPRTKRKGGTLVERYLEWCGWLSYTRGLLIFALDVRQKQILNT